MASECLGFTGHREESTGSRDFDAAAEAKDH
jgi:hypothetical protein